MNSGTGSVYQRASDGRWVAAVTLNGRRVVRYAASERAARQWLKEMIGSQATGTLATPTRITLGAWCRMWLEMKAPNIRVTTLEQYTKRLRPFIALFDNTRLDKVTPLMLAMTFNEMQRATGGPTMRKRHTTLRDCLDHAVRLGVIATNPMHRVDRPQAEACRRIFWTTEEMRQFLAAAEGSPDKYAPMFTVMLACGLRRGEALALTWSDVDLHGGTLSIIKSITFISGNKAVHSSTKTAAGTRVISLPGVAVRALRRVPHSINEGARIFTTRSGGIQDSAGLHRALTRLCDAAGVRKVGCHQLRHAHASLLLAEGTDPTLVQRRLGHARLSVTLGVYAHAVRNNDTVAADVFDKAVGG